MDSLIKKGGYMIKKLLFIFVLATSLVPAQAQTVPDRKTTVEYITKLFNDVKDFEYKLKDGTIYAIDGKTVSAYSAIQFIISIGNGNYETSLGYCFDTRDSKKLSFGQLYMKIDWAKMIKIEDSEAADDSAVKFLYITFTPNSVLERGYYEEFNPYGNILRSKPDKGTSSIYFPYKNELGVKERLIKALNHLSNLDKKEKLKNDPFGN
ncbi:hypothetical protein NU08_4108 [Flavobacterium anhuiense]|uniref:DUF4468 domain-containing protein n=1 Tax=Flavobacterium anhuiense TaxID=459526 RepID=A0A444VT94_9FLAO|nr:hypothetical protein [Flavobacterium anhuiense]RYJ36847.1 hypothetical protein NU08_4108 [Flavobacterium anhuiense]